MKRSVSGGFTIVETMIVLGVMSVLFVSMIAVVRGQQSKAQFRSAVTDLTSQLQTYITQVSTGYYPRSSGFSCIGSGGGVGLSTNNPKPLGENETCVYMGQAVMLGIPAGDSHELAVHTLVGIRRTLAGDQPKQLREAAIQAVSKGSSYNTASTWPNLPAVKKIGWGGTIVSMKTRNGNQNVAGFAVVTSPNAELSFSRNTDQLEAGTLVPVILPVLNPNGGNNYGTDLTTGVDYILRSVGNVAAGQRLDSESYAGPIDICLASGTSDQSALISVGSNSSVTSVDFVIKNNRDCS